MIYDESRDSRSLLAIKKPWYFSLYLVTNARILTEVEVVHAVGHEDVVEDLEVRIVLTLEKLVCSVCPCHIFIYEDQKQSNLSQLLMTTYILH